MAAGERGLAAIMFTDIVGYTRLSQSNESLALEMLEEHRALLRPAFLAHGGIEIKTMGDAFLVEFKSALEAVLCAVELQKKLNQRNEGLPPSRKLELRIGIHVGDVVHDKNDIQGDAVNVASRIEPLAEPGGICISQQVLDQVRNKAPLEIDELGEVELRNVDLPLRVYRVSASPEKRPSAYTQAAPRERLAVLPFVNISPDPNDEYFADGLTEELIAKLSEIRGLKVIARTSIMSYKKKDKKVSEIARELGVGSIIEGSVRKAGNRIRIAVQLIDPGTQEHLWASRYDNELNDIFAIQSDVASKVARSLSTGILSGLQREETNDVEAYTLYLKAVQLMHDASESNTREAVALLQRAISKDPSFARAYALLADAFHMLSISGHEDFGTMANKAEAAAVKALELAPGLAEAHAAMSGVHTMMDRFDAALEEAETAVRINPGLSESYMSLGILDTVMRTPEEAVRNFKKAYELDPLSHGAGGMLASMAKWAGDLELAQEVFARLRELNPTNVMVYLGLADHYMENKDFGEAQKMIDAASALSPGNQELVVSQALLFAMTERREEAKEGMKKAMTMGSETFRLMAKLEIEAALGNVDEAFGALMQLSSKHAWPFSIRVDPLYAGIRGDPRFPEFCRKVGIPT